MPDNKTLSIVFLLVLAGIVYTVVDKDDVFRATTVTIGSDIDDDLTLTSDKIWRINKGSEIVVRGELTIEPFTVVELGGTLKIEDGGSIVGNNVRFTAYDAYPWTASGIEGEIDVTDFGGGIVMVNNEPGTLDLSESRMENQHRCVVILGEGDVQLVRNEFFCTDGLDIEESFGDAPKAEISYNEFYNPDTCLKLIDAGEQILFYNNELGCDIGVEMSNIDATDESDAFLPWFHNNFDSSVQFIINTMPAAVQSIRVSYHNDDEVAFGNFWTNSPYTHEDDDDGDGTADETLTMFAMVGAGPGGIDVIDDGSMVNPGGVGGSGGGNSYGPDVGISISSPQGGVDAEPYYALLTEINNNLRADVTFTPTIEGGSVALQGNGVIGSKGGSSTQTVIDTIWWDFGDGSGPHIKTTDISEPETWTYQTAGTYIVTAQVRDNNNMMSQIPGSTGFGTAKRKVIILPDTDTPLAVIGLEKENYSLNENIFFDGGDSYSPVANDVNNFPADRNIVSYSWILMNTDTMAGSSLSTDPEVTWTASETGNYTVSLTVVDERGFRDTSSESFSVIGQKPVAVLQVYKTNNRNLLGNSEETLHITTTVGDVIFDGSLSTDSDNAIVNYSFDFGDGTNTSSTASGNFLVVYDVGDYIVVLKVEDEDGNKDETAILLHVTIVQEITAARTTTQVVLGPVLLGAVVAVIAAVVWVFVWPKSYGFKDWQTYVLIGVSFTIIMLIDWFAGPLDIGIGG